MWKLVKAILALKRLYKINLMSATYLLLDLKVISVNVFTARCLLEKSYFLGIKVSCNNFQMTFTLSWNVAKWSFLDLFRCWIQRTCLFVLKHKRKYRKLLLLVLCQNLSPVTRKWFISNQCVHPVIFNVEWKPNIFWKSCGVYKFSHFSKLRMKKLNIKKMQKEK